MEEIKQKDEIQKYIESLEGTDAYDENSFVVKVENFDGPRANSRISPMIAALEIERRIGIETVLHYCCRDRNLIGIQADLLGAATVIRKDDKPETVLDRLAVYHAQTEPLKDYYAKQGKLDTVVGQEELSDTTKLTLAAVGANNIIKTSNFYFTHPLGSLRLRRDFCVVK